MEISTILNTLGLPVSTGIIILILSFIKIPKIEFNLWQLIGKAVSKGINGPVLEKINELNEKLDKHINESEKERAMTARARILRFSDEVIAGQCHTKDHYKDILITIDDYEKYSIDHPDFPNSCCLMACENIKQKYLDKCKDNSFVTIERLVQVTENTKEEE